MNTVPLLDAHQLLMLSAGTLTYLKPKLGFLIMLYTGYFRLLK
jgi:hypothetical protein